ncbi:tRNA threonylcarbamoyladenosine biosynthesis protein TsaE [Flavobacteriaceae bacterium UJ101]|nr:tRNA threonylcarbamoyladenosine biosynthesis protein TsaE [Flavobacteriaceae bacterium UJ101]
MNFVAKSTEDLSKIASEIIQNATYKIFILKGEMGVGKTTLSKELIKQLGSQDEVQSPTFSIVNEYRASNGQAIYHFDFYRIKNEEEALDMGYEDYFYNNSYCFIEWAEKIPSLIPEKFHEISLNLDLDQNREITFT